MRTILRDIFLLGSLVMGSTMADEGSKASLNPSLSPFEGVWTVPPPGNEQMTLREESNKISGSYRFISPQSVSFEGTIEAERKGNEIAGRWVEHPVDQVQKQQSGRMYLKLSDDGLALLGWYGNDTGENRTVWTLRRKTP